MPNFNGFGGGNMQQLLKQAQKMQEQIQKDKEQLDNSVINASSGGGMVEVKMTGKHEVVAIKIKPEVVDPQDIDMLEDLIIAAINDANKQIEDLAQKLMPNIPGGLF